MRSSSNSVVPLEWAERARYLEPAKPLVFPESADVPETQLHLDLRTLLYLLLSDHLGESFTVGSDQFVYWDAADPRRCIAPDVYAKRTARGEPIRSWKVWERGAPDVAIEIVSDSDSKPGDWREKFACYQAMGVRELVRLDLLTPGARRLRVWNRVNDVLREREFTAESVPSLELGVIWTVAPASTYSAALRIAYPEEPFALVPTAHEARKAAQARVAELEALLKAR